MLHKTFCYSEHLRFDMMLVYHNEMANVYGSLSPQPILICLLFSSPELQQSNNILIKSLFFWLVNFVVVLIEK